MARNRNIVKLEICSNTNADGNGIVTRPETKYVLANTIIVTEMI